MFADRILADSADRPDWLVKRETVIGASDAAKYSKLESVPLYALAKLRPSWGGNRYTESGNEWEPRMLAHFGIPRNTLLVHALNEPGFAATPDGVEILPSGEVVLSEAKAKHNRVVAGPTPAERRQVWWAQYCWGAHRTKWIWQELMDGVPRRYEPHIIIIDRDDDEIDKMLRIARPVLDRVRIARAHMKELVAA